MRRLLIIETTAYPKPNTPLAAPKRSEGGPRLWSKRQRARKRPKLDSFLDVVDAMLTADLAAPVKQHHTAKRIFERLRDEHGYAGGARVVKDYARGAHIKAREMFVSLLHPPDHAQVDFA